MQAGENQAFLVINSCKTSREKFVNELKKALPQAKPIMISDIKLASRIVRSVEFVMVFVRVTKSTSVASIEKLKSEPSLKFIPIIITSNDIDKDSLTKKFNMVHINGFLHCDSSADIIKLTTQRLLPLTSLQNQADTIMTTLIRAMLRKVGAQANSLSMVTKALILCRIYKLDRIETFACVSALKYLSISILTGEDYKSALGFFMELGLNNRTTVVLREIESPISLAASIVRSVYSAMKHIKDNENLEEWRCKVHLNTTIKSNTKYLFDGYAVFLQSGYDVEMITERVTRFLILKEIDQKRSKDFLDAITHFLTQVLLFRSGGVVMTSSSDTKITLSVEPMIFDEDALVDELAELSLIGIESCIDSRAKKVYFNLHCDQTECELHLDDDSTGDMFFDFTGSQDDIPAHNMAQISASEFFANTTIDQNDMAELTSIQDELNEICEDFELSHDIKSNITKGVKSIRRYASTLMLYDEFGSLAQTLMYSGAVMQKNMEGESTKETLIVLSKLLIFLTDDLNTFRLAVFVNKTASDIHFMDLSLISSCHQAINMFLDTKALDKESEDSKMFF